MQLKERTCCFFVHRKITVTQELVCYLQEIIEKSITEKKIDTFLFGSRSEFDKLCLKVVTGLKNKHPHIKRIYVRAEFPYINEDYMPPIRKNAKKNLFGCQSKSGTKCAYDYAMRKGIKIVNVFESQ